MIYSIGHDIVENSRINTLISKYGARFIDKVLTPEEQDRMQFSGDKARFVAKRFAAKEAFAKACGTGLRHPILMPNIIISNDDLGKPILNFNVSIKKWLADRHITHCHLSISDEVMLSSAFVVLETN